METIKYPCVPSFTSMHVTISKFEEARSNFKEKCLRLFFVGGCHGVPSFTSMCAILSKFGE